jgi:hypothetical protein
MTQKKISITCNGKELSGNRCSKMETKTSIRSEKYLGRTVIITCYFKNYRPHTQKTKGALIAITPNSYVIALDNGVLSYIGKSMPSKIQILKERKN